MPNYRRAVLPGGTFFLTLVTHQRHPLFDSSVARKMSHDAIDATRKDRIFTLDAIVLLPDHLHLLMTLQSEDSDFSTRVGAIKGRFSRNWLRAGGAESAQSDSRTRQAYRGIWQKRFWEHCVRDESDLRRCTDYIHYNPVKHGLAACPHAWEWTSFHRNVARGWYAKDWLCVCNGHLQSASTPADIPGAEMD